MADGNLPANPITAWLPSASTRRADGQIGNRHNFSPKKIRTRLNFEHIYCIINNSNRIINSNNMCSLFLHTFTRLSMNYKLITVEKTE